MEEMEWRIQSRSYVSPVPRASPQAGRGDQLLSDILVFLYSGILVFWYSGIFISVSLTSISVNIQYLKYFQVFSLEWEYIWKIYQYMFLLPYHFP